MDAGMRPNFPPRFDGPPDFFRGPPRMHFDDQFARHRREESRRMGLPFDNDHGTDMDRSERRSRWGNTSPKAGSDFSNKADTNPVKEQNNNTNNGQQQQSPQQQQSFKSNDKDADESLHGSTTPLHDEPQDGLNSSNGNKSSMDTNQCESVTTQNNDTNQEQDEDLNESETLISEDN